MMNDRDDDDKADDHGSYDLRSLGMMALGYFVTALDRNRCDPVPAGFLVTRPRPRAFWLPGTSVWETHAAEFAVGVVNVLDVAVGLPAAAVYPVLFDAHQAVTCRGVAGSRVITGHDAVMAGVICHYT